MSEPSVATAAGLRHHACARPRLLNRLPLSFAAGTRRNAPYRRLVQLMYRTPLPLALGTYHRPGPALIVRPLSAVA
jgi:hypothetical protein